MSTILSKRECNVERQKEIDLAKGIAIIFMIWVHVNETYLLEAVSGGIYSRVVEFLGSPPAAPVFMFSLGIGIVYSRRSTTANLFERGINLFLLGYILNFIRDFLPYYILFKMNNDISYIRDGWELLWGIDILQFSGLVFIFFSLVKKFKLKNVTLYLILCGFVTLNILIKNIYFESAFLNRLMGLVWGTDEFSWFPFLTWIAFPILGYYFGQLLIRCNDKNKFYKKIFFISGSISIPLWIYSYINDVKFGAFGALYQTEYYHHDIVANIILSIFVLFWISICFFSCEYIPEKVYDNIKRWSGNITKMYCIHQIILGLLLFVLEENMYTPIFSCILSFIIFCVTDICCIFFNSIKDNRRKVTKDKKAIVS